MIHYAVIYYSQAMKRKCWHAESEAGLDFATQARQKYNLWLWQALKNFPQVQVFWLDIPVFFSATPQRESNNILHSYLYFKNIEISFYKDAF